MEYEKGSWYWFEALGYSFIMRCLTVDNEKMYSNEVCLTNGDRYSSEEIEYLKYCKGLATTSQIEQCLSAYARKNGYVSSKIVSIHDEVPVEGACVGSFLYDEKRDQLLCKSSVHGAYTVYHQGRWADIVQEPRVTERIIPIKEEDIKNDRLSTRDQYIQKISKQHAIEFAEWLSKNVTINVVALKYMQNGNYISVDKLYEQFLKVK